MPEGTQLPGFFDAMLIPQSIFTNKTEEEQRDLVVGLDLFCQAKGYDRVRLLPDTEPDGIHFEYLPFDQGGLRVNNNNDELSFSLFPPMFPGNDLPYISKMTCEKIDVEVSNLQNTEDGQFGYAGYFPYLKISDDTIIVWSEILKKIKNSKLILKSSASYSEIHFKKLFEREGILNKVIFENR